MRKKPKLSNLPYLTLLHSEWPKLYGVLAILSAKGLTLFSFLDTMRGYLQQIRQETGVRMCEKVFDPETDKPSKVRYTIFLPIKATPVTNVLLTFSVRK